MNESVDDLFTAFAEAFAADPATRPRAFLARAGSAADRAALAERIEAWLEDAPARPFDRAAFAGSPAEATARRIATTLPDPGWPALLPRLRAQAQVRRADLVARLAHRLGVGGREERVAEYLHAMERGLLPADGVSDRVLDALGELLGTTRAALRRAGEAVGPASAQTGPAFARAVGPVELGGSLGLPAPPAPAPAPGRAASPSGEGAVPEPPDEVDRLFTGGP